MQNTLYAVGMTAFRNVLDASLAASERGDAACLVVVAATSGSTYVRAGAMALFAGEPAQVGWLSGGCLEPEIERRARAVAASGVMAWMSIDTRDDEDLLSGSAVGCRGHLLLALLPLQSLHGWPELVRAWRQGEGALHLLFIDEATVQAQVGIAEQRWEFGELEIIDAAMPPASLELALPPPPQLLVFGAGPETAQLLPLLKSLGWRITLVERRQRWLPQLHGADVGIQSTPAEALASAHMRWDAALVMNHHFEMDREALVALAQSEIPFVGLLGPNRRREDLFKLLGDDERQALLPRLHSPVGLKLGGQGTEAIALSIAAQLQSLRFGSPAHE